MDGVAVTPSASDEDLSARHVALLAEATAILADLDLSAGHDRYSTA